MDGVLVHEGVMVPGADEFVAALHDSGRSFLVITNNPRFTPRDLSARLEVAGLTIPEESLWTSALATARFLESQRPDGTAFVIGEAGLTTALHDIGYVLTDRAPDYVVLGETHNYSFTAITTAIRLVADGSRFIATNPDPTGPSLDGLLPACGAVAALITRATGVDPYFVGKPNPLMVREGLNTLGRPLGDHGDGRRPDGHRHDRRDRGRPRDHPGAVGGHQGVGGRPVPLPSVPDRRLGGRPDRRAQAPDGLTSWRRRTR